MTSDKSSGRDQDGSVAVALFPLTLYSHLTIAEVITSQEDKQNRTFQVLGEKSSFLFVIERSVENIDEESRRCIFTIRDRTGEKLASLVTNKGYTKLQCCCKACAHMRLKRSIPNQDQSARLLGASDSPLANICHQHKIMAIYDTDMESVLFSTPVNPSADGTYKVSCVQGQTFMEKAVIRDEADKGYIFSIEAKGTPSAKDILLFISLGLSLFLMERVVTNADETLATGKQRCGNNYPLTTEGGKSCCCAVDTGQSGFSCVCCRCMATHFFMVAQ